MLICLEQGADLHMAQRVSLPLTVSCFSKIQIGFTFLVPAHPGSPGKRAVKRVCVCVCVCVYDDCVLVCIGAQDYGCACAAKLTRDQMNDHSCVQVMMSDWPCSEPAQRLAICHDTQ